MLTKSLTPARVDIKNADTGEVEAVFATLNVVDRDGDVILPGAIADGATVAVSAYGHKSWMGELPVGKGTIHEVDDELVVRAQFFLDTDQGRNTFGAVKGLGDLGEWSWSLQEVRAEKGTWDGAEANLISKVGSVKEVSPVFAGAGINTRTLAVKADNPDGVKFSEHLAAVMADVDELTVRAEEVVALRTAKGKTISDEAAQTLSGIADQLERIRSLVEPAPPIKSDDEPPSIDPVAEYLRFVAFSQGVTTS